jgi:TRAP-type C4-dicarboxylate transport system permease small subunit
MPEAPYRSAEKLVRWLTILLAANAVLCLLAALYGWRQMEAMAEFMAETKAKHAQGEGSWVDAYAVDVPLCIVALLLVRSIHRMQEHHRYTTAFD